MQELSIDKDKIIGLFLYPLCIHRCICAYSDQKLSSLTLCYKKAE